MTKLSRQFETVLRVEVKKRLDFRKTKKNNLARSSEVLRKALLKTIARGVSPITGKRFDAYKDPKKYPGNKKPPRPVNLKLSGDFLKSLRVKAVNVRRESIDYRVYFNKESSRKKEQGHREGAGGQPKRPIIPIESESYTDKIVVALKRAIVKLF